MHIFSHYVKKSEDEIRFHMSAWILRHCDWLECISKDILNMKKHQLDDYISDVQMPGFKMDEISILLIARMYHLKVAVLMGNTYWTTLSDNNLKTWKYSLHVWTS